MGIRCLDEWVDGRRRGSLHYAAMAGQAWTPRNPHRNVNINPFPRSCPKPSVLNPFLNLNPNPCPNPLKKTFAAMPGQAKTCDWLLANGCFALSRDSDGRTALHLAASRGKEAALRTLLNHPAAR